MSATIYAPPANPLPPAQHAGREQALAAALDPARLPAPPAATLRVLGAARRPDCEADELVALLALDSPLCGKLLRAANSCIYGLKQPVATAARAVQVLGLNTVRALALGLAIPAARVGRGADRAMRDYWLAAAGGAVIARELAVIARRPNPDDDLAAGLLRDRGELLLRQTFPDAWARHTAFYGERLVEDPCGPETRSFGVDHADVSAELLARWRLPADLVEPIRYHHQPALAAPGGLVRQNRAELLHFADLLVQLDAVAQNRDLLDRVLTTARDRFNLTREALVAFLQRVAPQIATFAAVLSQDMGTGLDYAGVLAADGGERVSLTAETNRLRPSGTVAAGATLRAPAGPAFLASKAQPSPSTPVVPASQLLPEYRPEFVTKFPATGCRLGSYELRGLLGRGAMGIVFRAFDPGLKREAAIKVLAPELAGSAAARERFVLEARLAASVRHENVVGIHVVRETAGTPYLAMEYVRGSSLEARTEQHGPTPVLLLVSTARQIAAGLAAAHAKNIIHRDVKPANVLLDEATGGVKLTDFGLARVLHDEALASDGPRVGTPFYMAPEVIDGQPSSALSDLYSLGCVMYTMATGRVPFPGQTLDEVYSAACSPEPVPPVRLRAALPDWLDEMILRLLHKDPAARYPDAASVAAILGECC